MTKSGKRAGKAAASFLLNDEDPLCLSTNVELALLRSSLLRARGMDVDFPQSKQEAITLIETGRYDMALLCHSLGG
jgi:hypothetical protein